jgi:fumarate hydratase subunit alpha
VRKIDVKKIHDIIVSAVSRANTRLPSHVRDLIVQAGKKETSEQAKLAYACITENYRLAKKENIPICQDTGLTVVMMEIGQEVLLTGGDLSKAVDQAVATGSRKGFLRNSIVADPFTRKNTGNNAPAVLHTEIVPGDKLKITVMPKGGGAENMSFVKMMSPSAGAEGVENEVVEGVRRAGTNPCPPLIIGVGIGGNLELCALLAKKALLRKKPARNKFYSAMEQRILDRINSLGIGPQVPEGGRITALAVYIETAPCHIASLPLAVNINCHASRYVHYVL